MASKKKYKKIKISQSAFKNFKAIDFYTKKPSFCDIRWIKQYIEGKWSEPSEVMIKGLYFEHHVIGGTRGGEVPELPRLKGGGKSKAQKDLDELIPFAKQIIKEMGIKAIEVQPEWEIGHLEGHPDLLATYPEAVTDQNPEGKCIIDLKYTESKADDRFGEFSWGDPESKSYPQVPQYVLMHFLMSREETGEGEVLPFYYLVFGKSGWVKMIEVVIDADQIEDYWRKTREMYESVPSFNPKPIGKFNECRKCPFFETVQGKWKACRHRTKTPEVEVVEYKY